MPNKGDIYSKIYVFFIISFIWTLKHEKLDKQLNLQIRDVHFHPENFCFKGCAGAFETHVLSV